MNKKNIENLLEETNFSKANPDFYSTLKNRLKYKIDTNTLSNENSGVKEKFRLRPITSVASVFVFCILAFAITVYGNEIISGIKNIIKISNSISVYEYEGDINVYFENYYMTVNNLLNGKIFDANGESVDYFVKDSMGNFEKNSVDMFREDGEKIYDFTTNEDGNRKVIGVNVLTEDEYTELFGNTIKETFSTIEDLKESIDWDFKTPAVLPEGYSFEHAVKETTYMKFGDVQLTIKLYYNNYVTANAEDSICLQVYNKNIFSPQNSFYSSSENDYEVLDYSGKKVFSWSSWLFWEDTNIDYILQLSGRYDEVKTIEVETIFNSFE